MSKRLPRRRSSAPRPIKKAAPGGARSAERIPLWRRCGILLSLLGFVIFFLPVFGRILNLANGAAMLGFLLLIAVFLKWPRFLELLRRIWSRRAGKLLLSVTGLGLAALLGLVLVLCCRVAACLRERPTEPCPTVIVLGCQVRGSTPSLLLSYRIQTAGDYLEENPESVAILSGGQGAGEDISEAECMFRALTARGIDPARLYLEDASGNTQENLQNSRTLMEREGLEGPVAIVSNGFHVRRALIIAGDLGLDAQGLAAPSHWYSRPTYVLREALAIIAYALT